MDQLAPILTIWLILEDANALPVDALSARKPLCTTNPEECPAPDMAGPNCIPITLHRNLENFDLPKLKHEITLGINVMKKLNRPEFARR